MSVNKVWLVLCTNKVKRVQCEGVKCNNCLTSLAYSCDVFPMEVVSLNIALCVQVDLSMEDIETILNTLIYDGKVEMTIIAAKEGTVGSVDGQMKLYR